ncbi:hypothetical protein ACFX13_043074 [Malus domestica]|uniref:uncharacterized zinc finger CCHC domain-containing protein At4g19190 n=1 Tax=Malus domestica TaxID=3750 RepID=UPI000498F800|nr:uncharacterized zinc finger CCHC domain-containing protein At4g19190 [Malus domestica]XP_050158442.1 uncharacterized zinc finger CCHC domain-containing protein At4g19190 [Malus sylvestris]
MEGEEEGGIRLSKRFSDKGGEGGGGGEVDYKNKSGTAWSHSYLNQKPWHPLSYPNQRRKWIAEQIQAQRQRRTEEVSREYAQEQEFFRQAALVSKKDKEKIETMKAVSFMYVRPPGYNAESAKAAEIADESAREHPQTQALTDATATSTSSQRPPESLPPTAEHAKKSRPKDVFGRPLPTEQEFEVLKNAPRLETGVPTRAKPFGVEVRNVKCVRCGTFGHQSGDRECPLKDAIMPNEESRLKRDDPLTAILAHTDPSEPLKWELKQKPGISPPRGGFKPDDPNQQIVAEDTIFDEYGGFLSGNAIPELLTNFSSKPRIKSTKKNKHKKKQSSPVSGEDGFSSSYEDDKKSKKKMSKVNKKKHSHSESSSSEILEFDRHKVKRRVKHCYSCEKSNPEKHHKSTKNRKKHSDSSENSEIYRHRSRRDNSRDRCTVSSEDSEALKHHRDVQRRRKHSFSFEESIHEKHRRSRMIRQKHSHSYEDSKIDRHCGRDVSRDRLNNSSEGSESDRHLKSGKSRHRHSNSSEDSDTEKQNRHRKSRDRHSYSYGETENEKHHKSTNRKHKRFCT